MHKLSNTDTLAAEPGAHVGAESRGGCANRLRAGLAELEVPEECLAELRGDRRARAGSVRARSSQRREAQHAAHQDRGRRRGADVLRLRARNLHV